MVKSCSILNPHYTITASKTKDEIDDEVDEVNGHVVEGDNEEADELGEMGDLEL